MLIRHPQFRAPGNTSAKRPRWPRLPRTIWEAACGHGATVRVLRDAGHRVIATDLIDCVMTSPRQSGTMSTLRLTRQRRMKKLSASVDRVTQADRLFFDRLPYRQHRIRLTSQAEIARQELIDGRPITIPPGFRWFAAVHNIAKPNLEGAENDLDEATAREVFEWVSRYGRSRRRCAGLQGFGHDARQT